MLLVKNAYFPLLTNYASKKVDIRQTNIQTDKQTNRHDDSMTDPAKRAESVKINDASSLGG